jgi:quinol monooxygenase YgiN
VAIGVIARLTLREGSESAFERAFARQAELVRRYEPGNRLYQLMRARDGAREYAVMEIYDDEAALDLHTRGEHLAEGRAQIGAMRVSGSIEVFDCVDIA